MSLTMTPAGSGPTRGERTFRPQFRCATCGRPIAHDELDALLVWTATGRTLALHAACHDMFQRSARSRKFPYAAPLVQVIATFAEGSLAALTDEGDHDGEDDND